MNCADCVRSISEWDWQERLPAVVPAAVRSHLGHCESCDRWYTTLQREQMAYADYGSASKPSRDLWPEIEARLIDTPAPGWFALVGFDLRWGFAAVFVVATVVVSIFVYRPQDISPSGATVAVSRSEPATTEEPTSEKTFVPRSASRSGLRVKTGWTAPGSSVLKGGRAPRIATRHDGDFTSTREAETVMRTLEMKYAEAIAVLTRDIDRNRDSLPTIAISGLEADLPTVDDDIRVSRRVARESGYEAAAVQTLNEAYDRKIALLRSVASK